MPPGHPRSRRSWGRARPGAPGMPSSPAPAVPVGLVGPSLGLPLDARNDLGGDELELPRLVAQGPQEDARARTRSPSGVVLYAEASHPSPKRATRRSPATEPQL